MPEKEQSVFSIVFASRMDADCSLGGELLLRIAPLLWAEAAKRGKALRICLLGGGNDCHRLRLLWSAACAAHPALSQIDVTLPGGVEDVRPYFASAQVFVGVSRAALEALSEGCSVVLAGNEGYGGLLTPQSFAEHAATNFCCRGREKPSEAAVLQDLRRLLEEGEAERRARTDALVSLLRRHYDIDTLAAKTLRFYSSALSQKRQLRLLCAGYFGRGNLGDEAILRGLMRRFDGAAAPGSLADAPWYTAPRGKAWTPHVCRSRTGTAYHARRVLWIGQKAWARAGVSTVAAPSLRLRLCALDRRRVLAAFGQLLHSDALLLGGGSLLQNGSRHGTLSLLYYLALCVAAHLCGCPFSLRANGIGPLRGRWARWAVALTLRGASGISLRDEASRQLLIRCGVRPERIGLLEDGVAAWRARCTLPVRRGNYVCICPRGGDLSDMSQLLSLAQRCAPGCPAVYVALDAQQDILGCAVLAALFPGRMVCPGSEREAAALLGSAAMVVSMRLHGLILAGKNPGRIALATQATADKLVAEVGGENVEKINKNFQKKAIQTPKNIV
jgi:polysaccharide pyruvyl transferase WcaK-like protein